MEDQKRINFEVNLGDLKIEFEIRKDGTVNISTEKVSAKFNAKDIYQQVKKERDG